MKKILALVLALLLTGSAVYASTVPKTDVNSLDPQQVVEAYYKSIQQQDFITFQNCLSDGYKLDLWSVQGSDYQNIKEVKGFNVSEARDIRLNEQNFREAQVVAEFTAKYYNHNGYTDGKQTRFIYLAKEKDESSPWKIISIGTGP